MSVVGHSHTQQGGCGGRLCLPRDRWGCGGCAGICVRSLAVDVNAAACVERVAIKTRSSVEPKAWAGSTHTHTGSLWSCYVPQS